MSSELPIVKVESLSVEVIGTTPPRMAVNGVSFEINANETLCLVGESGSGKSMIAHALIGLLPTHGVRHVGGKVFIEGKDITSLDEQGLRALRGTSVGMIFQEPMTALNPLMTVAQQIDEVFRAHTAMSGAQRYAKSVQLLADVQIPDPATAMAAYPFQLSGGQRQRVMIAMALALGPRLLIADEPTTALDVTTQAQILTLIRQIQIQRGIAVLFITHDFGVVSDIADRVLVMWQGRCVEAGTVQGVLESPSQAYTRKLIQAVPRLITSAPAGLAEPPAPALLKIENLSKQYLGRRGRVTQALDKVSLEVGAGETVGLVGESGSGKSTLGKMAVGLLQPDGGSILFEGQNIVGRSRKQLGVVRHQIQMVFQDPYASLNPRHRIDDIIASGPMSCGVDREAAYARAEELLRVVGMDKNCMRRFPHQFSGGQRQRISIARALAMQPKLLIADEAVSALDVSVQAQVLALLREIRVEFGLSMIFITHDLRVASGLCDRIVVMRAGQIIESGAAASVCGTPQETYTRELVAAIPGKRRMFSASSIVQSLTSL